MIIQMEDKFYCKRCNRLLKDKQSIKLGYGPSCLKKLNPKNKSILKYFEEEKNSNENMYIHR